MGTAVRRPRRPEISRENVVLHKRPVYPCEICPWGIAGRLEIAGTCYGFEIHAELRDEGEPELLGFRLSNETNGEVYDIDCTSGFPTCDCKGMLYHRKPCKHVQALVILHEDGKI